MNHPTIKKRGKWIGLAGLILVWTTIVLILISDKVSIPGNIILAGMFITVAINLYLLGLLDADRLIYKSQEKTKDVNEIEK